MNFSFKTIYKFGLICLCFFVVACSADVPVAEGEMEYILVGIKYKENTSKINYNNIDNEKLSFILDFKRNADSSLTDSALAETFKSLQISVKYNNEPSKIIGAAITKIPAVVDIPISDLKNAFGLSTIHLCDSFYINYEVTNTSKMKYLSDSSRTITAPWSTGVFGLKFKVARPFEIYEIANSFTKCYEPGDATYDVKFNVLNSQTMENSNFWNKGWNVTYYFYHDNDSIYMEDKSELIKDRIYSVYGNGIYNPCVDSINIHYTVYEVDSVLQNGKKVARLTVIDNNIHTFKKN